MLISITYVTLLKRCSTRSRKREERGKIEERWERTRKLCLSESELRARDCRAGLQRDFCPRKQRLAPYAALFRACVSTLLISYRNAPSTYERQTKIEKERERAQGRVSVRERLVLCKMYWLCARRLLCWCAGLPKAEQRAAGRTLERPQMCTGHNFYSG